MKYRIIWSSLPNISVALQRWLDNGWELQGGPCVIKEGRCITVYQAIVRRGK